MKKLFFVIVSIVFIQCNTYSMKTTQKRSIFGKFFHSESSQDEVDVPVDRVQLMDEHDEILPNLYVSSLAQVLEKRPKEFLDLLIQLPRGSVREFLAYQEFKDNYHHVSKEEHQKHINDYLSRISFEDDANIAQAISYLHEEKLTTMNFGHIREFLKKALREKMKNEEKNFKDLSWHMLPTCLLELNVGVVFGLGLYLLKKEENKLLCYSTLGLALSGMLILIPKSYRQGASLHCSLNKFYEYDMYSRILDQDTQDTNNKVIYHISN